MNNIEIQISREIFQALKGEKLSEEWTGPGGSYFTIRRIYDSPYGCFVMSDEENQSGVLYYIVSAPEQAK